MLFLAATVAALTMFLAITTERRLGPDAGGWVTALPISFTAALVIVMLTSGRHSAGELALNAAAHVPAQVVFALTFAAALHRRGLRFAITVAPLTYLAASCCTATLSPWSSIVLALPLLALAPLVLHADAPRVAAAQHWVVTPLTCTAGSVVVVAAVLANHLAGPMIGGAAAAFPTMSGTLLVAVTMRDGVGAGTGVLLGLVRGMPCYLAFCVTVGLTATTLGPASLVLAALTTGALATVRWRRGEAAESALRVGVSRGLRSLQVAIDAGT